MEKFKDIEALSSLVGMFGIQEDLLDDGVKLEGDGIEIVDSETIEDSRELLKGLESFYIDGY